MIDLIKEKIHWIESDVKDWEKYVNNTGNYSTIYYKFYYNGVIEKKGYFEGYDYLDDKEQSILMNILMIIFMDFHYIMIKIIKMVLKPIVK